VTPVADTRLAILDWGRTRYEPAWRAQESLVARRLAGEIPDTLIFTEHDPVYTVGLRSGAEKHLVWDADRLALSGIEVVKTNRGGDITYHGPGQIVVYPIVSLDTHRDLHAYLRFLEEVLIAALARFGLAAARRDGLTGIWIAERKLAAIGVSVRRWVACHGFALNVAPDLAHFTGIIPCGIAATDGTVTSLAVELTARGLSTPLHDEVRTVLAAEFTARWPGFIAPSSG
jgi:lipoyl(octanoyl) transferase